jgi:hypothetical protein
MNATRDPDAILNAWLDEGPTDLPDATRRAILTSLPTTPQARRGPFAPWRFFPMNTYARLAAAAVVAVIAIGGALYLIGPSNGLGGPGLTASPSPAPTAAATHPSGTPDTTTWIPFSSTVFGFDARYPAGWRLEAGTTPAGLGNLTTDQNEFFDHMLPPANDGSKMYGTSTLIPSGMSEDAWVAAYRDPVIQQFGAQCFPTRAQWLPVTLDGHAGGLYVGCNYVESTTFVSGRAYIFTYVLPLGTQPGADAVTMLRALISTVTLHPERAVTTSPAPS